MATKRFLRTLILIQIPIILADLVAGMSSARTLPEPLRSFRAGNDLSGLALVTAGIFLITWLTANFGLYFIWRPARTLLLFSAMLNLLGALVSGPFVRTAWEDMFDDASVLVTGMILGLLYFSPLKELFEKPVATSSGATGVPCR
jgi:hypothetical protein